LPTVALTEEQQQPAFHDHPGLQILRVADAVQNDVDGLAESVLSVRGGIDPGFDVDFVHKPSSVNPGISKGTLMESIHFSE
jgi:hypothetical protein